MRKNLMNKVKPITIVGCGPGSADYVTDEARAAVNRAKNLLGSERLLRLFNDVGCSSQPCPSRASEAAELIESTLTGGDVTVLVSGDPGLFSLSRGIIAHFGIDKCRVIPGISSIQVAFSRLGIDWRDAKILSAHADDPQWDSQELAKNDNIAILGGRPVAYHWLVKKIEELGEQYSVTLLENLTLESEAVRQIDIKDLTQANVESLVIIILQRTSK